MTSVIYQVIPHRPDNRPDNAPTPIPEGVYDQTTEQDNQSLMSVDSTTSDTAALVTSN